jgi:hypothetical protein
MLAALRNRATTPGFFEFVRPSEVGEDDRVPALRHFE